MKRLAECNYGWRESTKSKTKQAVQYVKPGRPYFLD